MSEADACRLSITTNRHQQRRFRASPALMKRGLTRFEHLERVSDVGKPAALGGGSRGDEGCEEAQKLAILMGQGRAGRPSSSTEVQHRKRSVSGRPTPQPSGKTVQIAKEGPLSLRQGAERRLAAYSSCGNCHRYCAHGEIHPVR